MDYSVVTEFAGYCKKCTAATKLIHQCEEYKWFWCTNCGSIARCDHSVKQRCEWLFSKMSEEKAK